MIAIAKKSHRALEPQANKRFLEFVPAIENYARRAFGNLRPQDLEEALCDVIAHAFCAFRRLAELGKQDVAYASPLARFAVARFRAGRRVGRKLGSSDIYSWIAQRRRGFCLKSLEPTSGTSVTWAEILADNRLTPIPDQVAFRLDFAAWLAAQERRSRKLVALLALGNTPSEAAQKFCISKPRVSQLRNELEASWREFQGEDS